MDGARSRQVAGLLFVAHGALVVLGITTAEALYPGYSVAENAISDLGATRPPATVVESAALVFNGTMVVSGLCVLGAAYCLIDAFDKRRLPVVVAAAGVGVVGVGLFPIHRELLHPLSAFLAFGAGGLSGLVAATVLDGPVRYVSAALGGLGFLALALFVALGGANPLGFGGLERWVAYPVVVWTVAFGGYLLGSADASAAA